MPDYYLHNGGVTDGPFDLPALLVKIRAGKITSDSHISDGSGDIRPAYSWPMLRPLLDQANVIYESVPRAYTAAQRFGRGLRTGWDFLPLHLELCVLASVVVLCSYGLGLAVAYAYNWQIGMVAAIGLNIFIQHIILMIILPIYHGRPLDFALLRERVLAPLPFMAISAVIITLLASLGLLLAIVPGVLVLSVFSFAAFLISDRGRPPLKALGESYRLVTKDNELFGAVFGLTTLNALSLFLVVTLPLTLPMIGAALAELYDEASSA